MDTSQLSLILNHIFESDDLLYAVLSGSLFHEPKITLRPVVLKSGKKYQLTQQLENKAFHQNLSLDNCHILLLKKIPQFKQTLLCTTSHDYQILQSRKKLTIVKKPPTHTPKLMHNRQKNYILDRNAPFLTHLSIKENKFRQLNRFLEIISDILPFIESKKLHIVDFGCGKAYLTFALYHYLVNIKGLNAVIHGLDLKKEVIETCNAIAEQLNFKGLQFSVGDINHFKTSEPIDMVISLHACDTATDAAIEQAIKWEVPVILSVPCCQHELFNQVESDTLKPILRHGILRERFAALVTDAARAELLEILGYQTQVLEFIDLEHTPKNLLIRAIKRSKKKPSKEYLKFKQALQISPSLERRFSKILNLD